MWTVVTAADEIAAAGNSSFMRVTHQWTWMTIREKILDETVALADIAVGTEESGA
jgi:hypothetical protein